MKYTIDKEKVQNTIALLGQTLATHDVDGYVGAAAMLALLEALKSDGIDMTLINEAIQ